MCLCEVRSVEACWKCLLKLALSPVFLATGQSYAHAKATTRDIHRIAVQLSTEDPAGS